MADLQTIVGKVLSDPRFADQLVADPAAALSAQGIQATPEMIEALKGLDAASLRKLAGAFGGDKAAV